MRNGTYIHIVTNLWKRICNFENIEIIGIPSPNASTIICDLAQNEQIKQQYFKFWSHLTVNFERNVYINVFAYFTYLFVYVRLFRIFFLCLSVYLFASPPVCLSVCLVRVINERWLVDQPVRVELCFTDTRLITKPAYYRQLSLKIFSVGKSCFRASYCHSLLNSDTRMIRTLLRILLVTVAPSSGFHCIIFRPLPTPKRIQWIYWWKKSCTLENKQSVTKYTDLPNAPVLHGH